MLSKGGILVAFVIFFFLLAVPIFANSEYIRGTILYIVPGKNWYIIPKITVAQNLVKAGAETITVTTWQNEVDYPFGSGYEALYTGAAVNGTMFTPSGSVDQISFLNLANGNYTYSYTFSQIGTYRLEILASSSTHGYSKSRAYIYVGKFPITVNIISGTEYQSTEEGQVIAYVEDSNGNPITGASGKATIRYPNTTVWLNAVSMNEIGNGLYRYNFTTPTITGMYTAFVNITSGSNFDMDGKAFHVAPWANLINKMGSYIVPRIITVVSWYPSDTARFIIQFRNFTGENANVSTCTLRITDPADNVAAIYNCTYDSVGNFHVNWAIGSSPTKGMYPLRLSYTPSDGIARTHYDAFRLSSGGPFDFSLTTDGRNYTSCQNFDVDFTIKNQGDMSLDVVLEYWIESASGTNVTGTYTSETILAPFYQTILVNRTMNANNVAPGVYYLKGNLRYASEQPEASSTREISLSACRPGPGVGAGYLQPGEPISGVKWIAWDLDVWNQGQVDLDVGVTKIELYKGTDDVPTLTEVYGTENPIMMKVYKNSPERKYACDVSYGPYSNYIFSVCSPDAPVPLVAGSGACLSWSPCHKRFSTKMPTVDNPCTDSECMHAVDFIKYCSPHWCKIRIYATGEDKMTTMGTFRTIGDLSYAEFAMTAYQDPDPETATITVVY